MSGLARRAGISRPTLYAAAHGEAVSRHTLARLSYALSHEGLLKPTPKNQRMAEATSFNDQHQTQHRQQPTVLQCMVQQMLRPFARQVDEPDDYWRRD